MNIFYLDHDVTKCAEMHNDKHVVKMILEYAQLLSTAHRVLDGTVTTVLNSVGRKKTVYLLTDNRDSNIYSATHINHPSTVWTRDSEENYLWLTDLWCELMKEYTYRYEKNHATERLIPFLLNAPDNINRDRKFTEPTPAMPDDAKVMKEVYTDRFEIDALASYRKYYIQNKIHLAKWKKRDVPDWYVTK